MDYLFITNFLMVPVYFQSVTPSHIDYALRRFAAQARHLQTEA